MSKTSALMTATFLAGALCLSTTAIAEGQAAAPKGEAVVSSVEVTATVTAIDQATREVTLMTEDGQEHTVVAGDQVQNLAQVKVGDVVTVDYTEALAYEVMKGGSAAAPATAVAGARAAPGEKPAGVIGQQTTVTVKITAIDPSVPSVTFTGPQGNSETIRVLHPEKLEGVSVGDTVQLTYTEALAIKVQGAAQP